MTEKTLAKDLLFFQAIPRKAIWGKTVVRDYFGYSDYPDGIGQTWAFADQPGGLSNLCVKGSMEGKTLHQLWTEMPQLFQSRFEQFPFIISLVGPSEDLSIQIHPNRTVAQTQGYSMGKNEAWYFIRTDQSSIVYGHHAGSKEELIDRIRKQEWDGLFQTVPVHDGDFVYIPSGTIHAMGKGTVTYEIQQATDQTYRIYDYDRKDAQGNARPLNTELAVECIRQTDGSPSPWTQSVKCTVQGAGIEQFISNDSFTILSIQTRGAAVIPNRGYKLCTVVAGEGTVNKQAVRLGDNFLVTALCDELMLEGDFQLLVTCEEAVIGDHTEERREFDV